MSHQTKGKSHLRLQTIVSVLSADESFRNLTALDKEASQLAGKAAEQPLPNSLSEKTRS